MKRKYINSMIICALLLLLSACNDFLEEQPRSQLTSEYFESPKGIKNAVVAVYSGLRLQYCREGTMYMSVIGTDEFRSTNFVRGGNPNVDPFDAYATALNPDHSHLQTLWNNSFIYINNCNGIIEKAPNSGLSNDDLKVAVGEAKFLRAYYYFLLVQTFGGVPLDLGAGELKFNEDNPTTISKRNSVAEVYAAIIADLKDAEKDLLDNPGQGRAGKAAAKHFLAKVYLTRAGVIADQKTDYYRNAYDKANELIDNRATYGTELLADYGNVNKEGFEHSSESLFTVEHTSNLTFNEGGSAGGGTAGGENELKENRACFMFVGSYESKSLRPILDGDGNYSKENDDRPVVRDLVYQRPWARFAPTDWLLDTLFVDKTNDSRFHNSFRTVWYCNVDNHPVLHRGDTALYLSLREVTPAERTAKYRIIAPSEYIVQNKSTGAFSYVLYPQLTKNDDTKRAMPNYASTRPFILAKLSETYLIAAEAALFIGENPKPYLKTIRDRAAFGAKEEDSNKAKTAMDVVLDAALAGTQDQILDFILDERSRELCGEQWRWFDLVRTGKLIERATLHNENTRLNNKIDKHHLLRPIPQGQIFAMTDENKASYQNPGY